MAAKRKAAAKKRAKPADQQPRSTLAVEELLKMGNPENPRKPMEGLKLNALRGLHAKFGSVQDVVVNRRTNAKGWGKGATPTIVGGHQRIQAAAQEGFKEYPVTYIDVTEPEERELNIGLNNVTGEWEDELLKQMLRNIEDAGGDLTMTGFDDKDLVRLLQTIEEGETDADAIPSEVPKRCSEGDLWVLGNHRLLCGDATSAEQVDVLLGGSVPNLMITDPPYGVNYNPQWRTGWGGHKQGTVVNDDQADWGVVYALFPGDVAYVWHSALHSTIVAANLMGEGLEIRAQIIWAKQNSVFGRGAYHWQHEPCWYAVRKGGTAHWVGDRKQSTIWEIKNANPMGGDKEDGVTHHGTQKPIDCMLRPMFNHKGDVFDPFCGSGTTIIAAQKLNRACYAMEISPEYCDVILARWEAFTGQEAVLDGS